MKRAYSNLFLKVYNELTLLLGRATLVARPFYLWTVHKNLLTTFKAGKIGTANTVLLLKQTSL